MFTSATHSHVSINKFLYNIIIESKITLCFNFIDFHVTKIKYDMIEMS